MNKEKLAGPALAAGGIFYTRFGWLLAPLALLFTLAAGLQLLRRK